MTLCTYCQTKDANLNNNNPTDVKATAVGQLDRTNDAVYAATTGVVRVIMEMIRGVPTAQPTQYVDFVKVRHVKFTFIRCPVQKSLFRLQVCC
jgi:Focal adhesion targeting region